MSMADDIRRLAEVAREVGAADLHRELLGLCERGADLERLLAGKERRIADLREALERERALRSPGPRSVLARRCPDWRELLRRITGWRTA